MRTTLPFILKNTDWLTVTIFAALAGGAILFVMILRLIPSL